MSNTYALSPTASVAKPSIWLMWIISVSFLLFQFLLQLSSGVLIKQLMHDFSLTAFSAGLLTSSYYYIYIALQAPAGLLTDKYGPRLLLSCGALLCGLACLGFAATHSVLWAQSYRLMMGLGASFAFVGLLYVIRVWFPVNRYAFMVGWSETLGMLGTIVGTIGFAYALRHCGWRSMMFYMGIIGMVLSAGLFILIKNRQPVEKNVTETANQAFISDLLTAMRHPLAWLNGLYLGLMFALVTVFAALWGPSFFQLKYNISLSIASATCSMIYLGVAIASPLLGYLTEYFLNRRKILLVSALLAMCILSIILYAPPLTPSFSFVLMILLGMCCSSYIIAFAVADDIAPAHLKITYGGFSNCLSVLSAPLLQPLIGWLMDSHKQTAVYQLHDYQYALSVLPLIMLIAAIIAYIMPETHPRAGLHPSYAPRLTP